MNYHRNKQPKIITHALRFGGVALVLFLIFGTGLSSVLTRGLQAVGGPLWSATDSTQNAFASVGSLLLSKKSLKEENIRLRENIYDLNISLIDYQSLLEQNFSFRELLGRSGARSSILAAVVTKPSRSLYDTFILDVGVREGVSVGDKVVYQGNMVVATITEVYERSSKALLYSSSGKKIDVILPRTGVSGVAKGQGSGTFSWELPRGAEVSKGDVIALSGIERDVVGVVEYIDTSPSDPFKRILFKSPVNIFTIMYVEVVEGTEEVLVREEELLE